MSSGRLGSVSNVMNPNLEEKSTHFINLHLQGLYSSISHEITDKLKSVDCNYEYTQIMGPKTVARSILDRHYKILCKLESENASLELIEAYCALGESMILGSIRAYPQNSHMLPLFLEGIKRLLGRESTKGGHESSSSSEDETVYSTTEVSKRSTRH